MMLLTQTPGIIPAFTKADRLRKARELTGLDQGQFAAAAGISRQTVSNYESAAREPRPLYLRAWAEATGVDLHWLETGKAPAEAEANSDDVRPKGLEPLTFCFGDTPLADEVEAWLLSVVPAYQEVRG